MKAQAILFLVPGGIGAGFATALVDAGVKSGVLLLLAAIAAVALRKSAAATRHVVWAAAMTCALAMPILSLCLPQWRVLPSWMGAELAAPEVGSLAAVLPPLPTGSQVQMQQTSGAESETLTIRNDSLAAASDAESPVVASISMQPIRPDFSGSTAVLLGWAIGAGLLLLGLLRSAWSLHRLSRQSEIVRDGMLPNTLKEVAHELRLGRSVTIHVGFADAMPMVWGVWRAHLLLPSSAEQWPPARLRTVMLHELAHVRRRDPLTLMLAQLARAVHWFNPLAWIAVHRLRVEQEQACDDDVLRAGVKPSDYASDVLEIATALRVTPAAGCMALSMASPARLESRLRAIVEAASNRTALTGWTVAGAMVAAIALALPLAMVRAADDKPEAQPPEVTAVEPPPSASIATPAEPPAFGPVVERTIYDTLSTVPEATRAGETKRDGQGNPIDPLTGAVNEAALRGKNVALRDARAVVDEWLAHIAADRTDQMWALTTREQGGLSLDVSKAWAFKSIRAKYVLGNDSAAMVVSTRYKDNAGRIRVLLCTLVNRDDRWLIHEHLYGNPEDIQLRVAGFAAYPGVRYDVRPEDIVGQWKTVFLGGGSTFHIFKADGSGETQEMKGGQRGKMTAFRWDVQGDVFRRHSGDQTYAGTIVRLDDEHLAVRHGDGQVGYERVPDDSATPRGVRATPAEMPGFIGFAFGPGDFREITSVVDGSPAAAAGLERGDYVVVIDGKPTAEIKNVKEFKTALAGAAGTEVQLSIRKVRSGETVAFTLRRLEVPLVPGKTSAIQPNTSLNP